jgi:ABC-type transport system substrate-binding protein
VQAYSDNEYQIIANIYTPPLQYAYLKRPYQLIPFTTDQIPRPAYYDKNDRPLPENADSKKIAYSVYEIHIKPGFKYQPNPAFATSADGRPMYLSLTPEDLRGVRELRDFKQTGTREVIADDYIYQIKRLAHPRLHSPIFGLMSEYIIGLNDYAQKLKAAAQKLPPGAYLDLNQYELTGVTPVDRYTYRIRVKGKYPQFLYWLAMPFFAPVPAEVDRFYSQPGMAERNFSLDWYPVGTGPVRCSNVRSVVESDTSDTMWNASTVRVPGSVARWNASPTSAPLIAWIDPTAPMKDSGVAVAAYQIGGCGRW